jgi:hypothetical protein
VDLKKSAISAGVIVRRRNMGIFAPATQVSESITAGAVRKSGDRSKESIYQNRRKNFVTFGPVGGAIAPLRRQGAGVASGHAFLCVARFKERRRRNIFAPVAAKSLRRLRG